MKRMLLVLTLLAACTGTTGPKGLDPTVLIVNENPGAGTSCLQHTSCPDTVFLAWWDQAGQTALFKVPPGAQQCTHFTSTTVADSVRYVIWEGDTTGTPGAVWFKSVSTWFDPRTGIGTYHSTPHLVEFQTATATPPNIMVILVDSTPPC